ncbi:hypothetical protein SEPCBS119000_002357 [Sporothrix epigloea]|uniref:Uncharacterized protein n=1 Tax=Sporothrix epigloea TaxID=1892477 RepID=A0ABP0DFT4_9PEZI
MTALTNVVQNLRPKSSGTRSRTTSHAPAKSLPVQIANAWVKSAQKKYGTVTVNPAEVQTKDGAQKVVFGEDFSKDLSRDNWDWTSKITDANDKSIGNKDTEAPEPWGADCSEDKSGKWGDWDVGANPGGTNDTEFWGTQNNETGISGENASNDIDGTADKGGHSTWDNIGDDLWANGGDNLRQDAAETDGFSNFNVGRSSSNKRGKPKHVSWEATHENSSGRKNTSKNDSNDTWDWGEDSNKDSKNENGNGERLSATKTGTGEYKDPWDGLDNDEIGHHNQHDSQQSDDPTIWNWGSTKKAETGGDFSTSKRQSSDASYNDSHVGSSERTAGDQEIACRLYMRLLPGRSANKWTALQNAFFDETNRIVSVEQLAVWVADKDMKKKGGSRPQSDRSTLKSDGNEGGRFQW